MYDSQLVAIQIFRDIIDIPQPVLQSKQLWNVGQIIRRAGSHTGKGVEQ